jgi:hypothetical protein
MVALYGSSTVYLLQVQPYKLICTFNCMAVRLYIFTSAAVQTDLYVQLQLNELNKHEIACDPYPLHCTPT